MACTFKALAGAKLNLSLDVLSKTDDGYHLLKMISVALPFGDTVTVSLGTGKRNKITANLPFLSNNFNNHAYIAAEKFFEETNINHGGYSIDLLKRTPVCAGLGGGTSDAAAILNLLNRVHGDPISRERLMEIGMEIGADVPFSIVGGTALVESKGEIVTPVSPLPPCFIVLCKPLISLKTSSMFKFIDEHEILSRPDTDGILKALNDSDIYGVSSRLLNVFFEPVSREYPVLRDIESVLLSCGAIGASMSGSGPTMFGIFDDATRAELATKKLKNRFKDTFFVRIN